MKIGRTSATSPGFSCGIAGPLSSCMAIPAIHAECIVLVGERAKHERRTAYNQEPSSKQKSKRILQTKREFRRREMSTSKRVKLSMAESSQLTSHKKQINKTFRQICLWLHQFTSSNFEKTSGGHWEHWMWYFYWDDKPFAKTVYAAWGCVCAISAKVQSWWNNFSTIATMNETRNSSSPSAPPR